MSRKASNRNRHTGRMNAFKKRIVKNGESVRIGSVQYFRLNGSLVRG